MDPVLKKILMKYGNLSESQINKVYQRSQREKIIFMYALELENILSEEKILELFSAYYKCPKTNLAEMEIPSSTTSLIPKDLAKSLLIVPIDRVGNNIIIATADPKNLQALDRVRFQTGYFAKPTLASMTAIKDSIKKYYLNVLDISKTISPARRRSSTADSREEIVDTSGNDNPTIKLVNTMLLKCMQRKASDIHIEPYEDHLRIRLRIDGVLHSLAEAPKDLQPGIISRVKIMSKLDIAEARLPQDGAINVKVSGNPIDFRVSCLPTVYGEKIVMRVLDKSALKVDMAELGMEPEELQKFKEAISKPLGMVLVTGPTGSGKTTTLYSALSELNKGLENIMTAEDPVEYNIAGINQVQMKPDIGLNFASTLRSFLRQDPDIIMVGEIRDSETAEIATKASLTGHLVISTLHTNSAVETITRLLNMGVESYNLTSALNCITAQRLLRVICQHCKVPDKSVSKELLIELGLHESYASKVQPMVGAGCRKCSGTGNSGRLGVHEVLTLNDPIKEGIIRGVSNIELKKIAMMNGMKTLRQSALIKLIKGIVSVTEVARGTSSDTSGSGKQAVA